MNSNKKNLIKSSDFLRLTNNSNKVINSNDFIVKLKSSVSLKNNTFERNDASLSSKTINLINKNLANSGNTRPNYPMYRLAAKTLRSKLGLGKDNEKIKKNNQIESLDTSHLIKFPSTNNVNINHNNFSSSLSNSKANGKSLNSVFMIGSNIKVGLKLGNGNFGEIRLAKNLSSGENLAIKFEKSNGMSILLKNEFKFYKKLIPHEGIPNVFTYIENSNYKALVMELLGPSLEDLFNLCNRVFSLKTICMIAIQVLKRIEYVHENNIVYRDIKPENFLIGHRSTKKDHIIYLIDFGLAKEFINSDTGEHIIFNENKNLTGTARYMSINTHLGREQSRRDDLEAIAHMLLYFLRGSLPWQGLKADNIKERYEKIAERKQSIKLEDFCKDLPNQFFDLLNYSRMLNFNEKPDYQSKIMGFQDLMKSKGWWPINWYNFDWSDKIAKHHKNNSNTNK